MPNLSNLADTGVRWERAYSNGPATPLSFPTILTGTYPSHYGGPNYMSDDRPFLASKFNQTGYETAALHTNPNLRVEKNYDTGFDFYNDFDEEAGSLSRIRYLVTQNLGSDSMLYRLLKRGYHLFRTASGSTDYAPAPGLNSRALTWLDAEREEEEAPFFLWIHYMDVHYPFYPPSEFVDGDISRSRAVSLNGKMHEDPGELSREDVSDLKSLYRGDVSYLDHHLGDLMGSLEDRGLCEETLFVVTSDHGELFGEYGLFGHPPSCYEESLHVPLIFFGDSVPEDTSVDHSASLIDMAPTVADYVGLETDHRWEGMSLRPTVEGTSPDSNRPLFFGDVSRLLACQAGDWRLVWWREDECPLDADREFELLRVASGEPVPIEEHDDVVAELKSKLDEHIERAQIEERVEEPDVDGDTQQQLEALGYR